jgi:rubrerythrin
MGRRRGDSLLVAEFALNTSHVAPLQTLGGVEPMQVLMGVFDDLDPDEAGALQILFEPCERPWEANLKKAILDELTQEPIMKEPDLPSCLRRKIASPFFAVSLRVVGATPGLLDRLLGYVNQFSTEHNRLVPLDDLPASELTVRGVAERMAWRPGMLWCAEELASFVHLPPESVFSDKMSRVKIAKRPAPAELLGVEGVLLGENLYHNRRASVRIPPEVLNRHMLIAGSTRMGKSTLMGNMLASLIRQGKGVFVIDPKGSLAKAVASAIPPEFVEKTVYFNPADRDHPVAMNLMRFAKHYDRQELINDLVHILDSVTVALTATTPRMWELFANAMRFFLKKAETDETITLRNVRDFFHDAAYRRRMVAEMENPIERTYWEAYDRERAGSRQPDTSAMGLTSRLAQLTDDPTVANILCAPECRIDFREIFRNEGVFIADLGDVGEHRKDFLGRLLVAEAQLSCMKRPASERTDVFFFMDEFQQYQTSAFDTVLAQGAEYRMNMALAHQNAAQVEVKTMQSVLGNVGTIVAFRVGEDYAARLTRSFGGAWESKAFLSLPEYECLARVGTAHFSLRSYSPGEYAEIEGLAEVSDSLSAVIEHTRERYAWRGGDEETDADAPPTSGDAAPDNDATGADEPSTRTESEVFSLVGEIVEVTLSASPRWDEDATEQAGRARRKGARGPKREEDDAPPTDEANETASDQLTLPLDETNAPSMPDVEGQNAAMWRCPVCGEEFPRNPGGNARHLRACQGRAESELPHVCPTCGRRFKTPQAVRSHTGRAHRG